MNGQIERLLVFLYWLIHELDKTLGPLSYIFYFILEWTVAVSPEELKRRKEENRRNLEDTIYEARSIWSRSIGLDDLIDRMWGTRSISHREFPIWDSTSLYPFPTDISNLSHICILIIMYEFGAINRVLFSTLRHVSINSLINLR